MKSLLSRGFLAMTVLAGAVFALASTGASAAPAATGARTTLAGSVPAWATAHNQAGTPRASTERTFQVQLQLRDAAGAAAVAAAVANPRSASYGHYLTPAQFDARYAPKAAQVRAVMRWLRAGGFHIGSVPANDRYVEAWGTVAQIDRAFRTEERYYKVEGMRLLSPASAPSVPRSIAGSVLAVTGLDDSGLLTRPDHILANPIGAVRPSSMPVKAPCSKFYGQYSAVLPAAYREHRFPTNICGYDATQLENGYGVAGAIASGHDGAGQTVAITDAYASTTIVNDVNAFSKGNHLPMLAKGQLDQILPPSFNDQNLCGPSGWNLEETLDIEAVHAMAPAAKIVYVAAKNCAGGLTTALNDVVTKHLAPVVSDSWTNLGENLPPAGMQAEDAIFVQGAAEGIGFNFSSGDDGDLLAVTGQTQPSFPPSDPHVTAVGGTTLAVSASGAYDFETGWGNMRDPVTYTGKKPTGYGLPLPGEFYAGSGGGTSHVFAEPSYQQGVVPTSLSDEYGTPSRVVPDVSALADPYTGMLEYETVNGVLTTFAIGGTSLASPLFTGIEALANQGRSAAIGFANPLLYSLAGTAAFHDVMPTVAPVAFAFTSTNPASLCYDSCVITEGHDSSLSTTAGFDNVTGLGSPNGAAFLSAAG